MDSKPALILGVFGLSPFMFWLGACDIFLDKLKDGEDLNRVAIKVSLFAFKNKIAHCFDLQ